MRKPPTTTATTTTTATATALPASLADPSLSLPKLFIFDLDYTLWPFWVDTHVTPPLRPSSPTSALDADGERYALYPDVPSILARLARTSRLAVASRTCAPHLARALLKILHIPPTTTTTTATATRAIDVFDAGLEIYPSSKTRHVAQIHRRTGVAYRDMLFFDDEPRNRDTEALGLTFCLVRQDGLTWAEVERGVDEWRRRRG